MCFKRLLCVFLILSALLLVGCGKGEPDADGEGESTQTTEPFIPVTYEDHYGLYMKAPKDVTVTLTVSGGVELENRFSLLEEKSGYTLTDLSTEETRVFDEDANEADVLKIAGYLPPYESAFEAEGGYQVKLSGEVILEMLLSGSNIFSGYDTDSVTLDGECVYTATADYGITGYSYEFAVNITDGETAFPAKIKYLIEVNK